MRCAAIAGVLTLCCRLLAAGPLGTYIFTGTASGSLGGVPFAAAPFTLTATADTANIGNAGIFMFNELDFQPGAASFTLDDRASGVFSTLTYIVDNYGTGALLFGGLFTAGTARDLLSIEQSDLNSTVFSDYFLERSIGPLGPVPNRWPFLPEEVPTSAGSLLIGRYENITFQATVVPEPTTWMLIIPGFFLVCVARLNMKAPI